MRHHRGKPRIDSPEMLAHIGARLDGILLYVAAERFAPTPHEQAFGLLCQPRLPVTAEHDLDHVPTRASEVCLELLDDLPVSAHRPVQPLQVAVHDEDQVLELLARRNGYGAERFGLVGLTVAEERPDAAVTLRLEPAVFEIAIEAGLINRHQRSEAHRHRRELPTSGQQPRMRIRRKPAAGLELATEVSQLLLAQAPLEQSACIDTRRCVPLKIDDVAFVFLGARVEEM